MRYEEWTIDEQSIMAFNFLLNILSCERAVIYLVALLCCFIHRYIHTTVLIPNSVINVLTSSVYMGVGRRRTEGC